MSRGGWRARLAGRLAHPLPRQRMLWLGGGIGGLVVVLAVVVWLVWFRFPERTPRALAYQDFDVCVLVDSTGIVTEPAAGVWAGLQRVAGGADVRLSFLAVSGRQSVERAKLFVPTLVQQGCDVVVAIGRNQVAAVRALRGTYPNVLFLAVEGRSDVDEIAAQVSSLLPSA